MVETVAAVNREPTDKEIRLVIAASSAGTIFEWYDFFIYGTLAALIGAAFFPSDNETLEILLVWAGFAVGFGFRPLGAILFGFLGDRLGRKYTFLVTVTLMGIATAGVFSSSKPSEFDDDNIWSNDGWLVPVEYHKLSKPFRPKNHIKSITPFLPNKYSPLQKNGNGNQGVYLTEISPELASQLLDLLE